MDTHPVPWATTSPSRQGHQMRGLMRSISVTDPSQIWPTRLPCVFCHGRGGSYQGHGMPELIASIGGNERPRT